MEKRLAEMSPKELRELFRRDKLVVPTAGFCSDYVQANLIILPAEYAEDYVKFLEKNPRPCPVLEVVRGERPVSKKVAPMSNIATDFPLYRVYRDGILIEEVPDVSELWQPDMIAVLIGCSLTFEAKLAAAGIRIAHYETHKRVPMYDTNIPCASSDLFHGNYVVSMRPIPEDLVPLAVKITQPLTYAHGAPVHIGSPGEIGIQDLMQPDYGDPPEIRPGEVPVFWACGVTAQAVAIQAKPPICIAHSPGYMLITDVNINTIA